MGEFLWNFVAGLGSKSTALWLIAVSRLSISERERGCRIGSCAEDQSPVWGRCVRILPEQESSGTHFTTSSCVHWSPTYKASLYYILASSLLRDVNQYTWIDLEKEIYFFKQQFSTFYIVPFMQLQVFGTSKKMKYYYCFAQYILLDKKHFVGQWTVPINRNWIYFS